MVELKLQPRPQEVGRSVGLPWGTEGELMPAVVEVSGLWQKVRFLYSSSNMKVHHYNCSNNNNNDNNNSNGNGHLRV